MALSGFCKVLMVQNRSIFFSGRDHYVPADTFLEAILTLLYLHYTMDTTEGSQMAKYPYLNDHAGRISSKAPAPSLYRLKI